MLLDSGASANFVSDKLVSELSLPTVSMSSPVTVRVADGRSSVVQSSATVDLTVGTCKVESLVSPQSCIIMMLS